MIINPFPNSLTCPTAPLTTDIMTYNNTNLHRSKRLRTHADKGDIKPTPNPKGTRFKHPRAKPKTADPLIAVLIEREYFAHLDREKDRVVTFDHHVQRVSYLLNEKNSRIPSSLQADLASDVCAKIGDICCKITREITRDSSYDTKSNAAEALTQILECVCKVPGTLGEEVRRFRPPSVRRPD